MRNLFLTTRFETILKSMKHTKIVAIVLLTKIEKQRSRVTFQLFASQQ